MRALFLLTLLTLTNLAAYCGPQVRQTPAQLLVVAEPETAQVEVDERFAGSARLLAVRPKELTPGVHRVTVRAPGYFPHDLELDLPPGETTITVSLRPIP